MTSIELGMLRNARVLVIGAGAAGLATGQALQRKGLQAQLDFFVIDTGLPRVERGQVTTARRAVLPGAAPPKSGQPWSVEEYERYLDDYATRFGIYPLHQTSIDAVRLDSHGHGLRCVTRSGEFGVRNVVVTVRSELEMPTGRNPGIYVIGPDARSWVLRVKSTRVARLIADRP